MVIGKAFAWAHLPKTGGDATLGLFRLFPELIAYADEAHCHEKHASFGSRESQVRDKLLATNIRRLPSWMLSHAQTAAHGLYPEYKPQPMASPAEIAEKSDADGMIRLFTDSGKTKIDRWLRTEYLREDFLEFISQFIEVTPVQRTAILQFPMINAKTYDHEVNHWFTPDQVSRMYQNNPLWASIEAAVYADKMHERS